MIVGLTGGIGSGKTTVANFFQKKGIPIYIADDKAKELMHTDGYLKEKISELLGEQAYVDGYLNRKFIAKKVFNDRDLLNRLNRLVHPVVARDFEIWNSLQSSEYVVKEAAVLFENGGYEKCDFMLLVTAPLELRIERVRKRDNVSVEAVMERVKNQWSDHKKISLSDAVIENKYLLETKKEVDRIHNHLVIRTTRCW